MTFVVTTIALETEARPMFFDVTDQVRSSLHESGIRAGIALVSTPHTTCSVLIQEESHDRDDSGTEYLMQDLVNVLEILIPTCRSYGQYLHPGPQHLETAVRERAEETWWSLNVDAHLRSVLVGRSVSIPINDGALRLGQFGRIYFADFDQTRGRPREVHLTIMGE
jgi:thiamine phosphate synthase YjbQ (UPF0047 family)